MTQIVNIGDDNDISLETDRLIEELEGFEEDEDLVLSVDGCCGFACAFMRERCLCVEETYDTLVNIVGNATVDLMEQFVDTCLIDNSDLSFNLTLFDTETCERGYRRTARNFECEA